MTVSTSHFWSGFTILFAANWLGVLLFWGADYDGFVWFILYGFFALSLFYFTLCASDEVSIHQNSILNEYTSIFFMTTKLFSPILMCTCCTIGETSQYCTLGAAAFCWDKSCSWPSGDEMVLVVRCQLKKKRFNQHHFKWTSTWQLYNPTHNTFPVKMTHKPTDYCWTQSDRLKRVEVTAVPESSSLPLAVKAT